MGLNAFVVIPTYILTANDINDKEKIVYGYVSGLTNQRGYCFATNERIAAEFNVSDRTISRCISSLVKKGYLTSQFIYGENTKEIKERRLYLVFPPVKKENKPSEGIDKSVGGYRQICLGGIDKFVVDNNINNNNIYIYSEVEEEVENSTANNQIENVKPAKKRTSTKKKAATPKEIAADSDYAVIMDYFNSKRGNRFKASSIGYTDNIDALLKDFTVDDIKNIIDYTFDNNFKEKYWSPQFMFTHKNMSINYENMEKGRANTQPTSKKTNYFIFNINTNEVLCLPTKPNNIPDDRVFSTREDAEKYKAQQNI